ncbi:MAG: hypothetical protein WAN86_26220, partial [Hyphomicrobiaceae bacterium]
MDLRRHAAELGARAASLAARLRKSSAKAMGRAAEVLSFLAAWAQGRCRSGGEAMGAIAARTGALAAEQAGHLQRRWQQVRSVWLPAAGARLAAWYRAARQARLVETTRHRLAATIEGLGKTLATAAQNAAPRLARARQRWD